MSFVVFAVENADRLTLLGPPVGGKPTFKQVALSFIHAPKQAKRLITGEFGPEDPCAYAATELVRAAFIGKPVKFSEDYYIEPLQRSAGRLTLATGGDAAAMLLEAGLALAPDQIPPRMEKSLFAQYGKLMAEAKTAQRGLFSPTASRQVRELTSLGGEQIAKRLDELHGKTFSARVERALSATALVVTCADAFGACAQFPVHMSGITVRELGSEELVAESKFHTERYLLHRNVNVRFDGSDAMGNVLVSVVAKKLFQEDLLHRGLAHIQNSTVGHTKSMEAFREAEAEAKSKRVGVWKTFTEEEERKQVVVANNGTKEGIVVANAEGPSGPQYQGPMHFTGILTQVVHGDTVVVRNDESGAYIRLTLAGVRSSKNIQRDQDGNSPETRVTYNDYSWEAKDFVRKHYIGEKVEVQVEFARLMPETKEIRPAATVGIPEKNVNIGAALLDAGFASFFLGKTDSCSEAVALQSAQDRAQLANRGMHGGDGAPVKVLELSHLGEKRSRYYLTFLQHGMQNNRPPVLKGVVDLVLGPSSLRVYIPHDNFQIPVKIAGVFTPNAALSAKDKADPFADESKDFAVRLLQQRDVNVQVYTTDRAGNFLCAVFLPDGTNAAVALVGAGLATVGHTDKLPFAQQLVDAEQAAKSNGKYIWSGEGAKPQRAAKVEAERLARNAQDLTPMPNSIFQSFCMTEVSEDGLSVYLQAFGEEVDGEKGKVQALVNRTVAMTEECNPRKGDLIVAQYSSDKTWCRARVLSIAKDRSEFEVQFIDFGNTEVVKAKYTRSVPRGTDFAMVRDVPPFAKHAFFACVKNTVPNDMYVHVACDTIYSYSEGEVLARPVYKDSVGNVYYCITTNEGVPTLGETLLQKGFVLLDPRTSTLDAELFKQHESAQSIARTGHKGLWQYGDVDDDDDE